jgi:UDP-3-O-[3-hydroxymyristoyl] glucosamine N-acyltransferase
MMEKGPFERAQHPAEEHVRFLRPVTASEVVGIASSMLAPRPLDARLSRQREMRAIGVSDGRCAAANTLCFVDRAPGKGAIERLRAALVITNPEIAGFLEGCALLVVEDARALFIGMLSHFVANPGFSAFTSLVDAPSGIHPTADIHRTAIVEPDVCIGADTSIAAGCVVKSGTSIGRRVTVRENTVVGGRGIALYKALDGRLMRMPDLAGVIIEDGVEIGASCALPRGVLTSTIVGRESVIGNLCNVGHAVRIGAGVWISVGTLIGGNSTIGAGTTIGLGAAVRDNLQIGRQCSIGMGSVVMRSLPDRTAVLGNPARALPRVSAGPER